MSVARLLRRVLFMAAASAPALLLGCAPSAAEVSGVIKVNGQAPNLKGLQISFVTKDGRPASAAVGEDGKFKADAVPVGDAVGVAFVYAPLDQIQQRAKSGTKLPTPNAGPETANLMPPLPNPIPEKLRDASTSEVTVKVEGGKKNVFNYDIRP